MAATLPIALKQTHKLALSCDKYSSLMCLLDHLFHKWSYKYKYKGWNERCSFQCSCGVILVELHVAECSDPVAPGAVWSSSLPAQFIRSGPKTAVLPGWTRVSGAQLLDMLLPTLPSVGGLFYGWTLTSANNHQVPAKQRASGQQLWPHNTHFQQRQSTTSESSLRISVFFAAVLEQISK